MQRRENGGGGQRQAATCKVDALGMASCMPICHTLLLASYKSWETLKQQPLVGHLSLDSLPYFTFFFWLFASTQLSTLKAADLFFSFLQPPPIQPPANHLLGSSTTNRRSSKHFSVSHPLPLYLLTSRSFSR